MVVSVACLCAAIGRLRGRVAPARCGLVCRVCADLEPSYRNLMIRCRRPDCQSFDRLALDCLASLAPALVSGLLGQALGVGGSGGGALQRGLDQLLNDGFKLFDAGLQLPAPWAVVA